MAIYRRPDLFTRIAVPLRQASQRFAFLSLVLLSFGLILFANTNAAFVERIRLSVLDVASPILHVLSQPVAAAGRVVANFREMADLRAENARLREQVARLHAWQGVAHHLSAENTALRELVGYRGPERVSHVAARVIADGRGPFVRSVLVNVGRQDAVASGQAAITPAGLAGRVSEAGQRSARVLLLTDLNSRIPVIIEETRVRAILAGDNSARPLLDFLPTDAPLAPGQRVVTSGHGGILPPGLTVGHVASLEDQAVRVVLAVDLERLEHLQIVNFETVSPPEARSDPAPPTGGERP